MPTWVPMKGRNIGREMLIEFRMDSPSRRGVTRAGAVISSDHKFAASIVGRKAAKRLRSSFERALEVFPGAMGSSASDRVKSEMTKGMKVLELLPRLRSESLSRGSRNTVARKRARQMSRI
jgi:hypothetical protein